MTLVITLMAHGGPLPAICHCLAKLGEHFRQDDIPWERSAWTSIMPHAYIQIQGIST